MSLLGTCVHLTCRGRGAEGGIASFWRFTAAIIVGNTDIVAHAQMLLKLYTYLQPERNKGVKFITLHFNRSYSMLCLFGVGWT
jgi:hypothetical protein